MKSDKIKNKIALITGAAGGIGTEIAKLFDRLQVKLALCDINKEKLQKVAKLLNQEPIMIPCDITNLTEVKNLIDTTLANYKRIDILVNTVGIIVPSLFEHASYDDINKQVNVNLIGTIHCTKEIIPIMKEKGGGNIVTISSLAGIVPETYSSIYTATKFALRGLNLTLNLELANDGIVVSTIFPDSVDTPMLQFEAKSGGSPLTFLDDPVLPSEVAQAVLNAIEKNKVEVCVPKSQGRLSKFVMCFPKLVQRLWPKFEKKGKEKKQDYLKSLQEKNTPQN